MAADLLEVDHCVCQVFILHFLSFSLMGDGPVLAEDTAEITVREKNGARPVFANQGYLFAKMGVSTENHGFDRSPAEPPFAPLPIYPTLTGTELALLENGVGLLDPLSKLTLSLQFLIGWMPFLSLFLLCIKGDWRQEQRTAQEEGVFYEIPASDLHT